MKVFHSVQELAKALPSSQCEVLTIGNFDGVHLGHQELIKQVVKTAKKNGLLSALLTFEPHPVKVLFPGRGLKSILEFKDRIDLIAGLGIDFVVAEPFSRELSQWEPEKFFTEFVVNCFRARHLLVGHDFNFGKNRMGTLDVLKGLCQKYRVTLEIVPPLAVNGEVVSSSKIREAVGGGDVKKAAEFLGRSFFIRGIVEKGSGRGRKIGYPTANLFSKAELIPKTGVYVTSVDIRGSSLKGATNIGHNPTFEETSKLNIETHILDFNQDIYGEEMCVHFLKYLRPEKKFASADDLVRQISEDVKETERYPWPHK